MSERAIEDHAVIGDLRTTALVGLDGAIDFMCWPRFDSPSIFASLLEPTAGIFELTAVLGDARYKQLYIPDTNVLLTRTLSHDGVAEISDFMLPAPEFPEQRLVRRAKAVRGAVSFRMRCAPRFDYGRQSHRVVMSDERTALFLPDDEHVTSFRLTADVPLLVEGDDVVAVFVLGANETATFVLDHPDDAPSECFENHWVANAFKRTTSYWREWVARSHYQGRWREQMTRSLLALKMLTSADHGSMVAAATFGLPEEIGGVRNWDYRYCWVRDASFMVYAFMNMGHKEEATAFIRWLHQRRLEANPDEARLKVLYSLDGAPLTDESELAHFSGYRRSRPVRVGNAAEGQLQLDIIGEVMDAIFYADEYCERLSHDEWTAVSEGIDWLCTNWHQPDESIWEVRGGRRHFLFSRFMCWVAFDRATRLAERRSLPGRVAVWKRERDAIYHDIHTNFWDEERQYFVQYMGGTSIDASCLLMPLMGFIGDQDPRWKSTLQAVGDQLLDDSLVYRYHVDKEGENHDGLTGAEGTFTMCSFWYVECLARSGDLLLARFLYEKMLSYANHVGLFSEEIGPSGEHLGNFPQAFTHLALIRAGRYLNEALSEEPRSL